MKIQARRVLRLQAGSLDQISLDQIHQKFIIEKLRMVNQLSYIIIYSFRDKLLERYGQDIWQESGKEYLQLREVRQIQIKIFKICENYLPAKDSGYIIISQPNANPLCPIIITQAHQFLVRQKTQLQKNLLQIGTLGVFRNIVVASIAPTSDIGQKENHYTVSCSAFEGLPYLS